MLDATPPGGDEFTALSLAHTRIKAIVLGCNERMRILEDRRVMQAIEAALDYSRLTEVRTPFSAGRVIGAVSCPTGWPRGRVDTPGYMPNHLL